LFFPCLFFILPLYGQNIIENNNFENSLNDWDSYFSNGYSGTFTQSTLKHSGTYAARINLTQVASNPQVYDVQIKTNNFHIEAGHDYHLSLWLKADKNVDVQIILVKHTTPWTWLEAKTVSLNTTYQHFDLYETNAPFTTDDDVRLAIRCGNEIAAIYLDDVVFTDCTTPNGYSSIQTSITGKGTISINDQNYESICIDACNDEYAINSSLSLTSNPEPGYTFDSWSGACSGNGSCQVTLSQSKYVGAHFILTGTDNSCIDYRNKSEWTNTGHEGAIPENGNIIDMTQAPYNCVGNGTYNNHQSLINALSFAGSNPGVDILYFPSGTFYFEGSDSYMIPSNTIIRGNCSDNTHFKINATKSTNLTSNHIFRISKWNSNTVGYTDILGGLHKRSKSIVVTDPSPFSIGDIIEIRQDNDTNKMNSNRVPNELDLSTFQDAYNIWGARSVGEIVKILNIIGNTLVLDRGLNFHYHAHLFPKSKKLNVIENSGIEHLKITRVPTANGTYGDDANQKDNYTIEVNSAYNCWIRNVESNYTNKAHVNMARSYKIECRDNYFHHSYDYGGSGHGYGFAINHRTSNSLFENNIFYTLRHAMVLSYGPSGNVFGYNYSNYSYDPCAIQIPIIGTCIGDVKADISLHGFYPSMNLFEGNIVEFIHSSDWWGPSGPGNTFFRNRTYNEYFRVSDQSHQQNIIGNETLYSNGNDFVIDSDVTGTNKHSNNDGGNIDIDKINTLPNSLYRNNNIPNFCDGYPFPQIGPVAWISNNSNYPYNRSKNPAQYRFDNSSTNAPCQSICNINSNLIDSYSTCDTSLSINLNQQNSYQRLYGIGIQNLPSNYGSEIPDLYIEIYNNGTLVQSTSNNVIESDPDTYIKISSIILDPNSNYEIKVYDEDLAFDDYIGNVFFSGSISSNNVGTYYSSGNLDIYLNKHLYQTTYSWSDGVTTNPRTFNQNGAYTVEINTSNGCVIYDTTNITVGNPIIITGLHTWSGTTDSDWFTACNWDKNHVPDYTNDVLIPVSSVNPPIISATGFVNGYDMNGDGIINSLDSQPGKAFSKTIEIENGAMLDIQVTSGALLEIQD